MEEILKIKNSLRQASEAIYSINQQKLQVEMCMGLLSSKKKYFKKQLYCNHNGIVELSDDEIKEIEGKILNIVKAINAIKDINDDFALQSRLLSKERKNLQKELLK